MRMKPLAGWVVSVLAVLLFCMPLIWMVQASFRTEDAVFDTRMESVFSADSLTVENYAQGWRRGDVAKGLLNSCIQVSGIVLGGLLVNSMAAYAFARLQFPGRDLLFAVVVILIILPVEVLAVPLFLTVRDLRLTGGYIGTMAALILPFMAKAFNIYFLRQHFLSFPDELEEAAIVDGAGPVSLFWRVALPSIRPALATVVVLDVLTHWGGFIWPLIVCTREETRTIQLSLANLFTRPPIQWGDIMACAVIATIPVVILFTLCQRRIVSTEFASGIR